MGRGDDELHKSYSALASPAYLALGMVFFGSAPRCGGGESSSPSPSRALPSGATSYGERIPTVVASRQ